MGVMKLNISCLLPYICYKLNLVKIGPVVIEKKMLTDDAQVVIEKMLTDDARRTPHEDGRQSIAIGHLSGSGDLKREMKYILIY